MDTNMRTELILDALQMAVAQRQPRSVIHHLDRGSQYASYAFGKRCQQGGIMPSRGSVGDAYDNAMAECFFATLEREVLNRRRFRSRAEARMTIFEWIEDRYPHRRHSGLGYPSPVNCERAHQQPVHGNGGNSTAIRARHKVFGRGRPSLLIDAPSARPRADKSARHRWTQSSGDTEMLALVLWNPRATLIPWPTVPRHSG
jgi:hypothetical protein